jgi:hypothetical protein
MSKAQRKRNRKVRNLQRNQGRIDREQREQSIKNKLMHRKLLDRNYSPRHPSIASNAEFLELVNG